MLNKNLSQKGGIMKHLIKKHILLLALIAQVTFVGIAQADTIALSFSGGTTADKFTNSTIGWEFTISEPINVTSLGVWDEGGNGLADDHQVGIWHSSGGGPLVSTTVTSADPLTNGFRYRSVSPFTLQPGSYVIGSFMPNGNDLSIDDAQYTTQFPVTYTTNLNGPGGFTIPINAWQGYDGAHFGPNFQFVLATATAVPSLNEWGMIIFMALAGLGSLYYLRKQKGTSR